MLKAIGVLIVSFCWIHSLKAQVEVYKGDDDTSNYIAPEDTITIAPQFGSDPGDIYRFIENNFNVRMNGQYLTYFPETIRFSFYVEKNGTVSNFELLYSSQQMLGNIMENIVMRMPEWKPGKEEGKRKRTLMVYDLNIQLTDDLPGVLVSENKLVTTFSNKHKQFKWFAVAGTVLIMLTLYITR
ncbi:MAG: hypothetical protein V4613_08165 [Bacteroidota bacterium]